MTGLVSLKRLILGGEVFPSDDRVIKQLLSTNQIDVFNIYGITELSCWSTLHRVQTKDLMYV